MWPYRFAMRIAVLADQPMNEWANFGKKDFEPVVTAFKELLGCFTCEKCNSWLYVSPPRGFQESLRCPCNAVNINLKPKAK